MDPQTLNAYIGDSTDLTIPLTWAGAPFAPGDEWALIFTVKRAASDPDTAAVIQKASGAGITVTGSTATVSLVPADTEDLHDGRRVFDIQAQNIVTGKVRTVAIGLIYLLRDVTRLTQTSVPVNTTEEALPFSSTGVEIHAADEKLTVADADEFGGADSEAAFGLKKWKWSTLKATLKTYFDSLYSLVGHTHTKAEIGLGNVDNTSDANKQFAPAIVVTSSPYNVVMGSTADQSTAMQAAVDAAAASTTTRVVWVPPGTVKCNITLPKGVTITGAGGGARGSVVESDSVTTLNPANNALPVILITALGGQEIHNFDIVGNGAGTSVCGIKIRNSGGTFPGMGYRSTCCRILHFTTGFWCTSAVNITMTDVTFSYCNTGAYGETLTDTWNLTNCNMDFCNTYGFNLETPRGFIINGGEHGNQSCPLLKVSGGGIVCWQNSNIESVGGTHIFEVVNSGLILAGNRVHAGSGSADASIVRQITNIGKVSFNGNSFEGFNSFAETGKALIWESENQTIPWPDVIAGDGALRITTSDTYATTRTLETADSLRFNPLSDVLMVDDFFGGTATNGAMGESGWSWYNWQGTSAASRPLPFFGAPGQFQMATGATSGDTFQLNHGSGVGNNLTSIQSGLTPWRMTFRVKPGSLTSQVLHVGIVGGTVTAGVPADFIGVKFNPAEASTFIAYARNASTNTATTALATPTTTDYQSVRIKCLAAGTVRISVDNGPEAVISSGLPGNTQDFGIILRTSESVSKNIKIDLFKLHTKSTNR